jgi:hypothetical protein
LALSGVAQRCIGIQNLSSFDYAQDEETLVMAFTNAASP